VTYDEERHADMMRWARKTPPDMVSSRQVANGYTIETTHDMRGGAAWVSPCGKYVLCSPFTATELVEYLANNDIHPAVSP